MHQILSADHAEPKKKLKNIVMAATRYYNNYIHAFIISIRSYILRED